MNSYALKSSFLSLAIAATHGCAGPSPHAAEHLAADAEVVVASSYQVALDVPPTLRGGSPAQLAFKVTDSHGKTVTDFEVEHTKLFHLIIVSRDLSYFTHIHPEKLGDGTFRVTWTPSKFDDNYYTYSQFAPDGEALQTVLKPLHVPGLIMKTPIPLAPDQDGMTSDGKTMLMMERPSGGFRTGKQSLKFMLHDVATGNGVKDLGTYLGASAHLNVIKAGAQGRVFIHDHDMGGEPMGHDMHGMGTGDMKTDGALSFDNVNLPEQGTYRAWVQYTRADLETTQFMTFLVH